jgi:hypothetical protein
VLNTDLIYKISTDFEVYEMLINMKIKSRRYFRLGNYDIWIECHREQLVKIRFEWLARGLRVNEILLKSKVILARKNQTNRVGFKCKNGTMEIKITPIRSGKVILAIRHKWFFFPIFWINGEVDKTDADELLNTISSFTEAPGCAQ